MHRDPNQIRVPLWQAPYTQGNSNGILHSTEKPSKTTHTRQNKLPSTVCTLTLYSCLQITICHRSLAPSSRGFHSTLQPLANLASQNPWDVGKDGHPHVIEEFEPQNVSDLPKLISGSVSRAGIGSSLSSSKIYALTTRSHIRT